MNNNVFLGTGIPIDFASSAADMFPNFKFYNNTSFATNYAQGEQSTAIAMMMRVDHAGAVLVPVAAEFYNNLLINPSASNGRDVGISLINTNSGQVTYADYNDGFAETSTTYSPSVLYQQAAAPSTATIPGLGSNDISVDPNFVDRTRNLAAWDASLGGPGTAAHAITEMLKLNGTGGSFNSNYTATNLVAYTQTGFAPQNAALHSAGRNGTDFGAVGFSDTTPPSVSITAPTNGATVSSSSVTLSATASDYVSVAGVQFKVDGVNIGATVASTPYTTTWNSTGVADGVHTLAAVAVDSSGNYATSSINVTVDNTAPVRPGGSPSGTLDLNTTATTLSLSTDEAATCKYSTASATPFGSMTAFPTTGGTSHSASVSGLTNGGSYVYYIKCQDGQGNTNATDYTISFTVAADTTSPTVTLTSPDNNSTVSGPSVALTAAASDDVSVAGVQFKLDNSTLIGAEDTSSPYTASWDSTAVADGTHAIIAVARDGSNNYATSSVITITIDNAAPMLSGGAPSGSLSSGTTDVILRVMSDENAVCRYGTIEGTAFASIANTFASTGTTTPTTNHSTTITGLSDGNTYNYCVRCEDSFGNIDAGDYTISFSVARPTSGGGGGGGGGGGDGSSHGSGGIGGSTAVALPVAGEASSTPATSTSPTLTTPALITSFPRPLAFGSSGTDVSVLQTLLKQWGYYTYPVVTGYFGDVTKAAVVAFQKANGIEPLGGMGPATKAKILGLTNPTVVSPTTWSSPAAFTRDLELASTGEEVRALQQYLNTHGFPVASKGLGSAGNESTYFGPATKAALIKFQSANGITPAVGYFGSKTRAFVD